jgi:uncharacterized FlgJ-related protein
MYYKFNKDTLRFEKINLTSKLIQPLFIVIGIVVFLGLKLVPSPTTTLETCSKEKLIILEEYNRFSEEKLIQEIKNLNFKYPHIVLAKSRVETGNFTSSIFKENNNLFGMKQASVRLNTAEGTSRDHAYYNNWYQSLQDYALYYATYLHRISSEEMMYNYLNQHYAENPNYIIDLKNMVEQNNLKEKFK